MRIRFGWLAAVLLLSAGCTPDGTAEGVSGEVHALLSQQIADWNSGDIAAFMDGYWRDERVRFASGGEVRRGWSKVMSDYERRYPDRAAMGTLHTAGVEISEISEDAAMVFGQWAVKAGGAHHCGLFTLLVRKVEGRWVVVHDHTSSAGDSVAAGRTCEQLATDAGEETSESATQRKADGARLYADSRVGIERRPSQGAQHAARVRQVVGKQ